MWAARVLGNADVARAINRLEEEGYRFNHDKATMYVMEPTEKYAKKIYDEITLLDYLELHMNRQGYSSNFKRISNKPEKDNIPIHCEHINQKYRAHEWINPIDWPRQHRIALALAAIIGAALAMAWGGNWDSVTQCVKYQYQCYRSQSTFYWCLFGGAIGASTIYVVRLMRSESPVEPSAELKAAMGMVVPLKISGPLFLQAELRWLGVRNVPLPFCEKIVADLLASSTIDPNTDIFFKSNMVDHIERTSRSIARLCRGDMPPFEMDMCENLVQLLDIYQINRIPWRGSERS